MNIVYGNKEGRWFTQWRFDDMASLAEEISCHIGVKEFKLWYDGHNDFHNLSFNHDGHEFEVRYYKVCSLYIDGESTGFPVQKYCVMQLVRNKLKELREAS